MVDGEERTRDSDEVLMQRYAHGDGPAFEELFRRYEGRVYAYFLRRTRAPDRAQDLYQELFLRLHRFRHTFEPDRRFSSWFFRIASRLAIDEMKRANGRGSLTALAELEPAIDPIAEVGAVGRDLARRALAQLSPEQARILIEAKLDGRTYTEIGARLGRSADAVKQIAARALRSLRAAYGDAR